MSLTVTVLAAAEPAAAWTRLADLERWPDWNPACLSASADGPLVPGTRLRLELLHPRGRAFWTAPVLREIDEGRRLGWETRALGLRAPTVITLEPAEGGTLVTLTSDSRGPLAFSYRLTFPEKEQGRLWSGMLTGLARSFTDGDQQANGDDIGRDAPAADPPPR